MPSQHYAIALGIGSDGVAEHQAKLKAGTLPRDPYQVMAERAVELLHAVIAIAGRSQSNPPVRVEMVHVPRGQECMKRRIDRSRYGVLAECAQRVHADHFIFIGETAISLGELKQFV